MIGETSTNYSKGGGDEGECDDYDIDEEAGDYSGYNYNTAD